VPCGSEACGCGRCLCCSAPAESKRAEGPCNTRQEALYPWVLTASNVWDTHALQFRQVTHRAGWAEAGRLAVD
jgi:hypothetical protein